LAAQATCGGVHTKIRGPPKELKADKEKGKGKGKRCSLAHAHFFKPPALSALPKPFGMRHTHGGSKTI